ncbi:MAG TPA: ScaI family restriction endonuclease [Ktedonobacteraceae bacterium]|jgi:hypothetical protein
MGMASPYEGLTVHEWAAKTRELIAAYPLSPDDLVGATLEAWESIFQSSIGGFYIGKDMFPKPQIMGFFLHELIPLKLAARFPGIWRADKAADEKDLVYTPDPVFSAEIKTSSHPSQIFGNRSYAQESMKGKKGKSGYYLAVNFEPFVAETVRPKIVKVRFGWLDHSDWLGQKSATGQQARLSPQVESQKLLQIHPRVSSFQASISFSK